MGGRKFRLSTHRKNEERKKRQAKKKLAQQLSAIPCELVTIPPLTISLPIESYLASHVQSSVALVRRLTSQSLPPSWTVASKDPLTLCYLRVQKQGQASKADVTTTISISSELRWAVIFSGKELTPTNCPLLGEMSHKLTSVTAVFHLISRLNAAKVCAGNPDEKFHKLWHHRALTLHGSHSKYNKLLVACNGYFGL